jgi:hypothetical protein
MFLSGSDAIVHQPAARSWERDGPGMNQPAHQNQVNQSKVTDYDSAVLANGSTKSMQICQPLEEGHAKWMTGEQRKNKENCSVPLSPFLKGRTETSC